MLMAKAKPGETSDPCTPLPIVDPFKTEAGWGGWDAVLYLGEREELIRMPLLGHDQVDADFVAELRRRLRLLGRPEEDSAPSSPEGTYFPSPRTRMPEDRP